MMDVFEKIEKSGQSVEDVIDILKLMEILVDVADSAATDLKGVFLKAGVYQQKEKQELNKVLEKTNKYVARFDSVICKDLPAASDEYGRLSDKIYKTSLKLIRNG